MLASEGFVVLCVAFFQYKNLVATLEEVEVEYFEVRNSKTSRAQLSNTANSETNRMAEASALHH